MNDSLPEKGYERKELPIATMRLSLKSPSTFQNEDQLSSYCLKPGDPIPVNKAKLPCVYWDESRTVLSLDSRPPRINCTTGLFPAEVVYPISDVSITGTVRVEVFRLVSVGMVQVGSIFWNSSKLLNPSFARTPRSLRPASSWTTLLRPPLTPPTSRRSR